MIGKTKICIHSSVLRRSNVSCAVLRSVYISHIDNVRPFCHQSRLARMLFKQCNALEGSVQQWRAHDVSVRLPRKLYYVADAKYTRRHEGNWKYVRPTFILSISEATGVDLWFDGGCIRGRAANQDAAQAKLEDQVSWRRVVALTFYQLARVRQL